MGYRWRRLGWPAFTPDFRGQHWLVTGGSGGLGRHIVLAAARAGATVTAAARSESKLAQLRADAAREGLAGIDTERCDFALQQDTARLLERLQAAGRKIDVLVNNVGVLLDDHSLTSEGRETSFGSNLLSHYLLTEGLIRRGLLAKPGGLVINMTSGGGYNAPLGTTMHEHDRPEKFNGTRRLCVPQARADRAEPVLARHLRLEGPHLLRDAPRLGGHRRRQVLDAALPEDPAG